MKAELFPHHMEKKEEISYKSTSILGLIYDKVKLYMEEDTLETGKRLTIKIEASEHHGMIKLPKIVGTLWI